MAPTMRALRWRTIGQMTLRSPEVCDGSTFAAAGVVLGEQLAARGTR